MSALPTNPDDQLHVISLTEPRGIWRNRYAYLMVDDGHFVKVSLDKIPALQREVNALAYAAQFDLAADPIRGLQYCQALMENAPEPLDQPGAITVKVRTDGKVAIAYQFPKQMPIGVALNPRKTLLVSNALKTAYQQVFL